MMSWQNGVDHHRTVDLLSLLLKKLEAAVLVDRCEYTGSVECTGSVVSQKLHC